jgi:uncharacterized protein
VRYRRFGRLDWDVSIVGLAAEGLPDPVDGREGATDAAAAEWVRTARYAIDLGENYLDLGHPYDAAHHKWVAKTVGQALGSGYQDKTRIAVTVPVASEGRSRWAGPAGFRRCLDEQLEWLGVDSVDFCLLGTLDRWSWARVREERLLDQAERAVAEGRARHLGFAFRDRFQVLKQILTEYEGWALARFEFSYMDEHEPGPTALGYAAEQGLAVVVKQPLKAGRLAKAQPPEAVRRIWAETGRAWSPAEWALRYVWDHDTVSTVVCDVAGTADLRAYLAISDDAEAGALTVRDRLTINRARDAYRQSRPIDCAACGPCMPCPQDIDVPRVFEIYNDAFMYGDVETASRVYREEGHHAERCTGCGLCESRCCQSPPLPISDWLSAADGLFGT